MKRLLSVLTGAAVLFSIGATAQTTSPQKPSAGISGKWTITWWGAGKEESFPIEVKASGENLTITGTHPTFKEMTGTGTLKGDAVSVTLKSASMQIDLTGKLAGNNMSGTRKIKASGGGPGGAAPGGQGGAPGGQGGAPQGGAPAGAQGGLPAGGAGGAPGGQGGDPAGGQGADGAGGNENWTAVKN